MTARLHDEPDVFHWVYATARCESSVGKGRRFIQTHTRDIGRVPMLAPPFRGTTSEDVRQTRMSGARHCEGALLQLYAILDTRHIGTAGPGPRGSRAGRKQVRVDPRVLHRRLTVASRVRESATARVGYCCVPALAEGLRRSASAR